MDISSIKRWYQFFFHFYINFSKYFDRKKKFFMRTNIDRKITFILVYSNSLKMSLYFNSWIFDIFNFIFYSFEHFIFSDFLEIVLYDFISLFKLILSEIFTCYSSRSLLALIWFWIVSLISESFDLDWWKDLLLSWLKLFL